MAQSGYRSPLPLLGLSETPPADVGFHSPLPLLGLSAKATTADLGYRAPLFLLGLVGFPAGPTPPPIIVVGGGVSRPIQTRQPRNKWWRIPWPWAREAEQARLLRDDDDLLTILLGDE